ncbi:V-type ATP synthase subunit I [Ruminococcus sp.]|uniref:V-type ATP synthase subunit I n=1 Tax=Ruminococcus sp. TaxID=41978 RepID=UPI002E80986F|nr:V-type ATP synthase subunit I [Ruminococcus sp.]MEE3492135.1 V-type ATP synthase subunit I [Ruminococcus sp.]
MAMLKMQRVYVYALLKYCKDILEALQRRGVVEIENLNIEDSVFFKDDTSAYQAQYQRMASTAIEANEILSRYAKRKKGLLSSFKGRKQLSREEYDKLVDETPDILRIAYDIISCQKNIDTNEAEKVKYQTQLDIIQPWLSLDVPMNFTGTATTRAFIGKFPGDKTSTEIVTELAAIIPEVEDVEVEMISHDSNQTCVFILTSRSNADAVSDALRRIGFEYPSYISPVIPKQREKEINKHLSNRDGRILENENVIKSYAKYAEKLDFLEDYYVMKTERYAAYDDIATSRNTFVLTGYVPEPDAGSLEEYLETTFDAEVEFEEATNDDAPVKLKNNKFAEPAESVLATYSYPDHHEADPTSIMAIFYYIFFGMMFSDAGYGLVMAIACAVCLLKFKGMEPGLKRSMKMFFWCGVSTTFWGLLFGSFFGDAVSVISNTFFHTAPPNIPGLVTPIWFNPVDDPMQMLMFSFLLGIIHLFTGLAILGYNYIRYKKDYLAVIYDVISWYLLVGGGILALLTMDMMENIAGFTLPPVFGTVGGIMAAIGAVIILFFAGRESKNPIIRLAKGAYGLYGTTGYLSDILSYSRLLALGLATGVIATVFNKIGSMMGDSIIGIIGFILIFIIGHGVNIGINALGAYVHTNRLQFVEFFGKFYTGGGKEFKPFKINTKHYTVKEEN